MNLITFLQVLGLVGVFASILGAWLSWSAKYNGKLTRELIKEENRQTRELIERVTEKIAALIVSEGEKTRELIKKMMENE